MNEKPQPAEPRSEFRIEIREILVWTTLIAIALTWIMPRAIAMDSAARWRLLMLSAIASSVPAIRFIMDIHWARRASKLRGRLLFSHGTKIQTQFMRCVFIVILALQFIPLQLLTDGRRSHFDVVMALYVGFMFSLLFSAKTPGFFHVQLFERGFVQFGRYITWDKYHTITVQELPNWAILLLDPVDESLPKEYHRIIALPLEKLPAVRVVVDLISSEMARR